MESSWRTNIPALGLADGDYLSVFLGGAYGGLAARDLTSLPAEYYLCQTTNPNYFYLVGYLGDDRGWAAFYVGTVPSTHRRFPYGRPVPPD